MRRRFSRRRRSGFRSRRRGGFRRRRSMKRKAFGGRRVGFRM